MWFMKSFFGCFRCFFFYTTNSQQTYLVLPYSNTEKTHNNQTTPYDQPLGNSRKKKLPFKRKKPWAEPGSGRRSWLLTNSLKAELWIQLLLKHFAKPRNCPSVHLPLLIQSKVVGAYPSCHRSRGGVTSWTGGQSVTGHPEADDPTTQPCSPQRTLPPPLTEVMLETLTAICCVVFGLWCFLMQNVIYSSQARQSQETHRHA